MTVAVAVSVAVAVAVAVTAAVSDERLTLRERPSALPADVPWSHFSCPAAQVAQPVPKSVNVAIAVPSRFGSHPPEQGGGEVFGIVGWGWPHRVRR